MEAKATEYIPNIIKDEDQFNTINVRQPRIIRAAADHFLSTYKDYLSKRTVPLSEQELAEADEDAKQVHKSIHEYINKPPANEFLEPIDDDYPDIKLWNQRLEEYIKEHQKKPNYLDTSILWTECYIYRSVASAFFKSKYFKDFDAFEKTKQDALLRSKIAATRLMEFTASISNRINENKSTVKDEFSNFLRFMLWGNKFDLSCSYGFTSTDNFQLVDDLKKQESKIISDSTGDIFDHFKSNKINTFTIVMDNSGFEALGDLCFVEMLYQTGLIDENCKIIFHLKKFPWFVSDVVYDKDFIWLLDCLQNEFESETVKQLAKKWSNLLNKNWELRAHYFWTSPYPFAEMKRLSPDLYEELSKSQFLIFKGDLNYRKLISDFVWDKSTSFEVALRGFFPSSIVSLRTVKCRPVVAVDADKAKDLPTLYWEDGSYAVIHFYKKKA